MKPVLSAVLLFAALAVVAQTSKPSPKKPGPCVAGTDEQCPTAQWVADYQKYKALVAKYSVPPELLKKYQMPQEVQDQVNGWALRLNQARPAGFSWDEAKQKWVKAAPQTPAPAPPPAPEQK